MAKRKLRVGDRVLFRDLPFEPGGFITTVEYNVALHIGYRYGVQWDDGQHITGYLSNDLEFLPNGLEVAWDWLEANGYG
jgi:hypothetical protein